MQKVRNSKYATKIRPIAHIHDAQYYIIPNDLNILAYVNEHLVKAVEWQDHPDIAHDTVKLGGNLSIFHPSWAEEIELPNNAGPEAIQQTIADHYEKKNKSKQISNKMTCSMPLYCHRQFQRQLRRRLRRILIWRKHFFAGELECGFGWC